jgi:hypothetical protein
MGVRTNSNMAMGLLSSAAGKSTDESETSNKAELV